MAKRVINKREKTLMLIALLLLLIYLAVQFAIYPLFSRYSNATLERNQLTIEKTIVETDIANKTEIEAANKAANDQYERITQEYPLLIPNEEIDRILTDLCLKNGLKPTALRFTDSYGAPQSESNNDDSEPYPFTVVIATMSMKGNHSALMNLLDDVDANKYIYISNLGYSVINNDTDTENANLSMTFELMFTNP